MLFPGGGSGVVRYYRRISLAALMVLIAGCATPPRSGTPPAPQPRAAPPKVNLSGFSAEFKRGYADGCESSRSLSQRRDERSFRSDADYAAGWNDGSSICRKRPQ